MTGISRIVIQSNVPLILRLTRTEVTPEATWATLPAEVLPAKVAFIHVSVSHIVFIPKYRRKEIYGKLRKDIGVILRQLCEYKGVEIIEAPACIDHIHMLVRIPPKIAVSNFMGYLKGKSSLMIFERHANLKYKYGNRNFWAKGYFVSTVGLNTETVKEYIKNQEKEDMMENNLSTKEYKDPFKG